MAAARRGTAGTPGQLLLDGLLAEKGVCLGVLHKWVNLGRGWRPRGFILEHGVLSYYKVEGPDKISLAKQLQRRPDARCIGEEAQRLLKKDKEKGNDVPNTRPLGEVHLKVSTLRASEADEKKFYIFSGTKTLHLKAETKEDRQAWLEVLQAIKDFFAAHSPPLEVTPVEEVQISTEPLRQRLQEAGVAPELIEQCADIVSIQIFGPLAADLKEERQRKQRLLSRLDQLEAEKHQLEEQLVQQLLYSRMELIEDKPGHERDTTDPNYDNEDEPDDPGFPDGEVDEDDTQFYEAADDFEQSTMRRSPDPPMNGLPNPSAEKVLEAGPPSGELQMDRVGCSYPIVQRRLQLPAPKQKEKPTSLWTIIKDNVGKDLSHVCLPVYFNEPISTLQKCFEEMEYSRLADRAYEWGQRGNQVMRLLHVAAFAVSAYAPTAGRPNKPFNPLLGETFEAAWEDKGCRFIAEKVSHHPNIVACHCEGQGWTFWGDCNLKNTFWGPSITLNPTGILRLKFKDGELFQWSKVTTGIHNIILGKPTVDHTGVMKVEGNRGMSVTINFKKQTLLDTTPNQVLGFVKNDKTGEKLATLVGKWDLALYYVMGDLSKKHQKGDFLNVPNAELLWQRSPPSEFPTRYNLTAFAISLNELTPGLKEWLPPTDSRLRPDQRALEEGIYDFANEEKLRLEQKQRRARKEQELGWHPRWFQIEDGTWSYQGGYWERREKHDWSGVPNIYGGEDPKTTLAKK